MTKYYVKAEMSVGFVIDAKTQLEAENIFNGMSTKNILEKAEKEGWISHWYPYHVERVDEEAYIEVAGETVHITEHLKIYAEELLGALISKNVLGYDGSFVIHDDLKLVWLGSGYGETLVGGSISYEDLLNAETNFEEKAELVRWIYRRK